MPPLAPLVDQKAGPRQRHPGILPALAQRSASFHGLGAAEQQQHQRDDLLRQRPRTHPDLLAGVRDRSFRRTGTGRGGDAAAAARVPWAGAGGRAVAPSKVLVTVAVQRSMWPLHVMARAEWRVADLVAAAVGLYVRDGRRPLLPSGDPSAFGLHYSQFSLQGLDPDEKVVELGSRSFFLYPRAAAAAAASSFSYPSTEASKTMATPAERPNMLPPCLGFMHFWPLL
ncbi:hypothetical protein SETIT_1G178300v2 [Setaria italica]|uniref:DUF7054 domain-containing protein n=1 Tax=Setaria italica TaxID=4555 RepID=K3YVI3_SETIT|nr:uncharacterized protein At4g22758 [Setaria italica]RCV06631.1 hypothetical protein SETIT_1G178300v2 [Setaria italica]